MKIFAGLKNILVNPYNQLMFVPAAILVAYACFYHAPTG